ncbi:hypothetical protein Q5752_001567 [Cryptotrichosporon argae]
MSRPLPSAADTATAHTYFLRRPAAPDHPPISILLRGVNLAGSSKFPASPSSHESTNPAEGCMSHVSGEDVFASAERGGQDGWYNGHPFLLDEADTHLRRLRAYGFTTLRYLVTWEALEHARPGKYDEAYIDYTISVLRKCRDYGFRVYISPHQDVFSRFLSGSGAPYWALLALGIHPRRVHQTGSAVLHHQWAREGFGGVEGREAATRGDQGDWPDMIWNTNLHRLAARHCFTMFFASEELAPKCTIDGQSASRWIQQRFNLAYGHLAERLRDAGGLLDECVIGWDSMNEPDGGFIGMPDMTTYPPSQSFKKGPSPTPVQAFQLGIGHPVKDVEIYDFTSLGEKKRGKTMLTPPDGAGLWLARQEAIEAGERWGWKWGDEWDFWDDNGDGGCVWAGHGVWDKATGEIRKPDYFAKRPDGQDYDFIDHFWRPHYTDLLSTLRAAHPRAISFLNPPVFEQPPDLAEAVKRGRVALSAHFYDGLTLLAKRRHVFNADAVGLQRGLISLPRALKFGAPSIKSSMQHQLGELKGDASRSSGVAEQREGRQYPTIIGEIGVPFDMKKTGLLGLAQGKKHARDYEEPEKAMDQVLTGCDGENALSYTLWAYEPYNTHAHGDGWNGEDLSIWSADDVATDSGGKGEAAESAPEPAPPDADAVVDLRALMIPGARGVRAWCRPYPLESAGRIEDVRFDMKKGTFELVIHVPGRAYARRMNREAFGEWARAADVKSAGEAGMPQDGASSTAPAQVSSTIFLPLVHYLHDGSAAPSGPDKHGRRVVVGAPEPGAVWGARPARVAVRVGVSEGEFVVVGQWATWTVDVRDEGREVRLRIGRAGDVVL